MVFPDGICHLACHLTIGHVTFFLAPVIAQISQVDKCRQHVVLTIDGGHVVLEPGGVNSTTPTCQHIDDIVLQAFIVHVDIIRHSGKCSCRSPETAATTCVYRHHNAIRIEHRRFVAYLVAVVPLLQFVEVNIVLCCQYPDLIFGKAEELSHLARFYHRVLCEVVQCRLGLIFLHRQNASHIDASEDPVGCIVFKHAAQPVDVVVHSCSARLELTADGIPLVDDEDKRLIGLGIDANEQCHQVVVVLHGDIGIGLVDVGLHFLVDVQHDAIVLEASHKRRDIQIDNRIFIQVLLKLRVASYLQVGKQLARVARMVVVGTEHLGCHRLTEATATSHTTEAALREQCTVDNGDEPRFVNVFAIANPLKSCITCVYINSHAVVSQLHILHLTSYITHLTSSHHCSVYLLVSTFKAYFERVKV